MQRVQISRRRGHEVTYTACFCRQATVLAFSSLPPRYNMEFLFASGERSQKICVRERLTPPRRGDTKQAVSPILSVRRRALLAAWGFLRFSDTITLIVL